MKRTHLSFFAGSLNETVTRTQVGLEMLQPFRLQPTPGLRINPHIVLGRNCHMATLMAYLELMFKSESRLSENQQICIYEIDSSFPLWSPSIPLFPCKHVHCHRVYKYRMLQLSAQFCQILFSTVWLYLNPSPFMMDRIRSATTYGCHLIVL